jgi:hypothetical protein
MRQIALALSAVALVLIGFGSGYWYRSAQVSPSAEIEDYALTNILEDLGYANYLSKGDTTNLRELLDVNLDGHLSRARQHQGAINDAAFGEAKIRTLNALANLWEQHPPFTSERWRENEANKGWWGEWQDSRAKNAELLRWAKQQCAATPSLNCKPPNLSLNPDASPAALRAVRSAPVSLVR